MNDDNLPIKAELIYFKEDVLKDIKSIISKLTIKNDLKNKEILEHISNMDSKLEMLFNKVLLLSNSTSSEKSNSKKIESLEEFRSKAQNSLFIYDSKFKLQSKLINDISYKIDSFINENIYYQGIIGPTPNCKYSNFHQFIDYLIANISQLNNFKDKTINLDYKGYKTKIDNKIEMLKIEMESNLKSNNNFTVKAVEECEERIKNLLKIYDGKLMQIRVENTKNISNFIKNFENMINESKNIKKDIYDKIKKEKDKRNGSKITFLISSALFNAVICILFYIS